MSDIFDILQNIVNPEKPEWLRKIEEMNNKIQNIGNQVKPINEDEED